jgi:hypothetical protein
VLGVLFGTLLLAVGVWRKNDTLQRASLVVFLLIGIAAGGVYLTGEPAEEAVEKAAGVTEANINRHETAASVATTAAALLGVAALALLWRSRRTAAIPSSLLKTVLVLGVVTSAAMAWTANRGGQIRHPELRGGVLPSGSGQDTGVSKEAAGEDKD